MGIHVLHEWWFLDEGPTLENSQGHASEIINTPKATPACSTKKKRVPRNALLLNPDREGDGLAFIAVPMAVAMAIAVPIAIPLAVPIRVAVTIVVILARP